MELWSIIVKSNTFNFVLMIALFAFIIKKCKLGQKLDDAIVKIKETIEKSQAVYKESEEELNKNIEKTKNIAQEIKEIEQKGEQNLKSIEEKLNKDNENQINSIKLNADRVIEAKEKEIVSELSKKTILASVEVAKRHIIDLLKKHPEYHQNFIKESIEELDRLK